MRYAMVVVIGLLMFSSPVVGQEVKAGKELAPRSEMREVLDVIWKAAIPALIAYLLKKQRDKSLWRQVQRALEIGVTDSYENFVGPLKHDKQDHPTGKLTEGDRNDARTWARNKAEEVLTGGAKRLFVGLAEREVNSLIEGVVSSRKVKGR